MDVCSRCGRPGHADGACSSGASVPPLASPSVAPGAGPSVAPAAGPSVPPMTGAPMPPGALGQSGAFSLSGSYAASTNPISRELRMLKTQLNLAVGQREEDPERAWLEIVSVRERLTLVADGAKEDPLLLADVERFRGKLDEAMKKLTRDVGDEVIAPLYSWVDLLRQRARLAHEVEVARGRVLEARASRGAPASAPPATEEEASGALAAADKELAWWRSEAPPLPSQEALAAWHEAGGDALRPSLPTDPQAARTRGLAALVKLDRARGRAPGAVPYVGSKLELVLLPTGGVAALLLSMFALASSTARTPLGVLAALGWVGFAGVVSVSFVARQRADAERRAAVDAVWHHTFFTEQAASLELEVGWLRALAAALRAQRTFDTHKGEGGQLEELARWRPDLEPVVVEVAKSSIFPPGA